MAANIGGIMKTIIALAVGALIAAFIVPVALDQVVNVSTSNYSSGAAALWNNMDLFVTLGVFGIFIALAIDQF